MPLVAQFVDNPLDPLSGVSGDTRIAIDHLRDGRCRNPSDPGDLGDGGLWAITYVI
jgi:hypothetical protein